jgi:hypothetical protein
MLLEICALQPSQLYIHTDKLIMARKMINLPPVPVMQNDGRWVLTDGHTRTVVALERGQEQIECVLEKDELDWKAYAACVQWCVSEGILSPKDLLGRVVSDSEYRTLWLARCIKLHDEIAKQRKDG